MKDSAELATLREKIARHEQLETQQLSILHIMEEKDDAPPRDVLIGLILKRGEAEVDMAEARMTLELAEKFQVEKQVPPDVIATLQRLFNLREELFMRLAALVERWEKP